MSLFKCKMCGGSLEVTAGASVIKCEYCGTQQTLPKLDDDKRANMYDRANHFRRNNEFDKAMGIYESILNEDNTDAEAYWSIVLCRYGIEYVEDPSTKRRIPTVNRAQFTSVFDDEDYKSAIANADASQREIYEAEAMAINEIQKGIIAISQKEEPFDIFICYKESDNNGRRTQDSVLATELYHELRREGFKVFFSRITLEDKLGIAYEPYIFAALHSAKVMVVLGTRPDHFNAVWVKNEWSRYLALIKNGEKKTLIPAYRDMDPYDLPEEFSHLQAQDMSKLGFMQDLVRGIKKIQASSVEFKQQDNVRVNAAPIDSVAPPNNNKKMDTLLQRGFLSLECEEWEKADNLFEQVLAVDPQNATAYLGKLLKDLKLNSKEELFTYSNPKKINKNSNYILALRFADDDLKKFFEDCLNHISISKSLRKKKVNSRIELIALNILFYLLAILFSFVIFGMVLYNEIFWWGDVDVAVHVWFNAIALVIEIGIFIFYRLYYAGQKNRNCAVSKSIGISQLILLILILVSTILSFILCMVVIGWAQSYEVMNFNIVMITYVLIFALALVYTMVIYQKRKLYILVRIISVCVIALVTALLVFLFYISPLKYKKLDDGSYSIAARAPVSGAITIPSEHKGKPVTTIWRGAFYDCDSLASIDIPDSVTSIGESAFCDCDYLTSITIPNSVTSIGESAFRDCDYLTSITIPNSVTSIGPNAFSNCDRLTSITIPNSVTSIGSYAFSACFSLKSITIPKSVTSIGEGAFYNCSGLTSLTIPGDTITIGHDAFVGCYNLSNVYCSHYSMDSYYDWYSGKYLRQSWEESNQNLINATRYYYREVLSYSEKYDHENYWHYVDGVPTPWNKKG